MSHCNALPAFRSDTPHHAAANRHENGVGASGGGVQVRDFHSIGLVKLHTSAALLSGEGSPWQGFWG
jgi:hypothetical protein